MTFRDELLAIAYEVSDLKNTTFAQFLRYMEPWDAYPLYKNEILQGCIISLEAEVHACILPEHRGKWATKARVNKILSPVLKEYGYVITKVPHRKSWGHKFVQKLGFEEVGKDELTTIYRLEKLKWV